MIDTLLALIPEYGLFLVFGIVALSCLAIPLPSSAMVLGAGGFAAAGDLILWHVVAASFAGFTLGDQIAFGLGKRHGGALLGHLRKRASADKAVTKAEGMIEKSGSSAVFLSRTVLSPLGPYMTYLAGAGGLPWRSYTLAAVPGAALWAMAYAGMGYGVADNLTQNTELLWNALGILSASVGVGSAVWWIRHNIRRFRAQQAEAMA